MITTYNSDHGLKVMDGMVEIKDMNITGSFVLTSDYLALEKERDGLLVACKPQRDEVISLTNSHRRLEGEFYPIYLSCKEARKLLDILIADDELGDFSKNLCMIVLSNLCKSIANVEKEN